MPLHVFLTSFFACQQNAAPLPLPPFAFAYLLTPLWPWRRLTNAGLLRFLWSDLAEAPIAGKNTDMELTQEQRDLLKKGEVVEFQDPAVGTVVLLLYHVYEAITDTVEERDLASLTKKAASDWSRDNPY